MINKNQVSLRQARQDCGISGSGGLKNVTEFIDRHGSSDYSLRDLGGHVLCFSSKVVTGYYRSNTNPGSSARPNYAEANVYSANQGHTMTLEVKYGQHCAEGYNSGNAVLGGFAYVGTIPSGTRTYSVKYKYRNKKTGVAGSTELIGWPSGYFVGTPEYYIAWVSSSDAYGSPFDITLDGSATPYITLNLQAYGGDYVARTEIEACYLRAV